MQIDTATKRRRSTEEEAAMKKDGQGKSAPRRKGSVITETDAERATRRASEMIARDFPTKEAEVTIKKLKDAWPETAAASQKANPQGKTNTNLASQTPQ